MKIAMGADHAGAELKDELVTVIRELGHEPLDLGGDGSDPTDDYPDFAELVGRAVRAGDAERGILVCGSGVGVSVAANKIPGIRAAVCHDAYSARQGVEHDDMNVLVLGGRIVGLALAEALVQAFVGARFSGEERHRRRLNKVIALEKRYTRHDE
ncbi:MAG: ribose 5-phosphate isomerase B [Anaerolineales bacterium]|nr:ribose 5-phosphate isomerase B [Anaerolineales bacterium]